LNCSSHLKFLASSATGYKVLEGRGGRVVVQPEVRAQHGSFAGRVESSIHVDSGRLCGQWPASFSFFQRPLIQQETTEELSDGVLCRSKHDQTPQLQLRKEISSRHGKSRGGRATTQVELLVSNRQQLCPTPTGLPTSSPSVHQVAARCVADEAVLRPFQVLSIYRSIPISPTAARGARHCC
jgi:hypothetical protein